MPSINDALVRILAFIGPTLAVVAQTDKPIEDWKMWAGAVAAGCAAELALLRPLHMPKPNQESGRG